MATSFLRKKMHLNKNKPLQESEREVHKAICQGKHAYANYHAALMHVTRGWEPHLRMQPYRCLICQRYHLGSAMKSAWAKSFTEIGGEDSDLGDDLDAVE